MSNCCASDVESNSLLNLTRLASGCCVGEGFGVRFALAFSLVCFEFCSEIYRGIGSLTLRMVLLSLALFQFWILLVSYQWLWITSREIVFRRGWVGYVVWVLEKYCSGWWVIYWNLQRLKSICECSGVWSGCTLFTYIPSLWKVEGRMKFELGGCIDRQMPAGASGMEGFKIGEGITGKVQLKCGNFRGKAGGGGVDKMPWWRGKWMGSEGGEAVRGCILRERSWTMGGLVGSPKVECDCGSPILWARSYPC